MRAKVWENCEVLNLEWLTQKQSAWCEDATAVPIWFDSWLARYMANTSIYTRQRKLLFEGAHTDLAPSPYMAEYWDICIKHGPAICTGFYKVLNSRPKTLVHGDLRSDNILVRKRTRQN